MKKISETIEITDAKYIGPFTLALTFSEGKKHNVDFTSFLKSSLHPEIKKYFNPKQFARYSTKKWRVNVGRF